MDFVKNQYLKIQQQLAGLTVSQKMLTASLVAVMVMTFLFWGRYAGTAEMVALLEQDLSANDLGQIQDRLRNKGVKFEVNGDRIMVPADRQAELYADLAFSKALPRNVEAGFDVMVKKLNPWAPASERDAMFNRAKEITCAQIIQLFPGVDTVHVTIDAASKQRIGAKLEPSANIMIKTEAGDGANAKRLADAAGAVVKGAEAGLSLNRISVVIDTSTIRLRDAAGPDGGMTLSASGVDQLELKQKAEDFERRKIEDALRYVPNLLVSVNVKIDGEASTTRTQTIDAKNTITKDTKSATEETSSNENQPTGEPGANPNIVANGALDAEGGAGGGGTSSTSATETIESQVLPSFTNKQSTKGPGEATVTHATVRVPRSYLAGAFRSRQGWPADKVLEEATLQPYIEATMAEMTQAVRGSAGMAAEAFVTVAPYDDVVVALETANGGVPGTATMSIPVAIGTHGKEIALGGLALVSLFMVSMMVRKSAPAPVVLPEPPPKPTGPVILTAGEMLAGEAGDGTPPLSGVELDDDAIQTQQMIEQVGTMVGDDPEAAAILVKRWMTRD